MNAALAMLEALLAADLDRAACLASVASRYGVSADELEAAYAGYGVAVEEVDSDY